MKLIENETNLKFLIHLLCCHLKIKITFKKYNGIKTWINKRTKLSNNRTLIIKSKKWKVLRNEFKIKFSKK